MSAVHPGFEAHGRIPAHDVHCNAAQHSDQMVCERCGRTQDVNEPAPAMCPLTGRDMRTGGGPSPMSQLIGRPFEGFDLWDTSELLKYSEQELARSFDSQRYRK